MGMLIATVVEQGAVMPDVIFWGGFIAFMAWLGHRVCVKPDEVWNELNRDYKRGEGPEKERERFAEYDRREANGWKK
jgi:hypothetical protein